MWTLARVAGSSLLGEQDVAPSPARSKSAEHSVACKSGDMLLAIKLKLGCQ